MRKEDIVVKYDRHGQIVDSKFLLNRELITTFNEFSIAQQKIILGAIWKFNHSVPTDNIVRFEADELEILMGQEFDRFAAARLYKLLKGNKTTQGIIGKTVSKSVGDDRKIFVLFDEADISWKRREFNIHISDGFKDLMTDLTVDNSINLILRQCFLFSKRIYPLQFYLYFRSKLDKKPSNFYNKSRPLKILCTCDEIRSICGIEDKAQRNSDLVKDIIKPSYEAFLNGTTTTINNKEVIEYSSILFEFEINKVGRSIETILFSCWYREGRCPVTASPLPKVINDTSEIDDSQFKGMNLEQKLSSLGVNKSNSQKVIKKAIYYSRELSINVDEYVKFCENYAIKKAGAIERNVGYFIKTIESNYARHVIKKSLTESSITIANVATKKARLASIPRDDVYLFLKTSGLGISDLSIIYTQFKNALDDPQYYTAIESRIQRIPAIKDKFEAFLAKYYS
jgi:translation initiation factor 2 beta subunit (eIF-2beta)/eIF-5